MRSLTTALPLFIPALLVGLLGVVTLYTFQGDNGFFFRQIAFLAVGLVLGLLATLPDYRFLKEGHGSLIQYVLAGVLMAGTVAFGFFALGAKQSYNFGPVSLQPVEFGKIALIALLAKYFSKRHALIGDFKHIFVSGTYAAIFFGITLLQNDFGSGMILLAIWLGLVLVAGIRVQHLLTVLGLGVLAAFLMWSFALQPYQKDRIKTFLDPLADPLVTGYNANQSVIAAGSGQMFGKGIGYGTQSKLQYLPESETDFMFAAFAEEWGFVGALMLFVLYGSVLLALTKLAVRAEDNFSRFFACGVGVWLLAQFVTHVGMNIGLLPITGLPLPFMSFGGSHTIGEYLALGMAAGMVRGGRRVEVRDLSDSLS